MRNLVTTIALVLTVVFTSCNKAEEHNYTIKGKYPVDLAEGKEVMLMKYDQGQAIPLDTVQLTEDGSFEFKGSVSEETFAFIDFGDRKGIFLFVDSGQVIDIDATPGQFISYTVSGSETNQQIKDLIDIHNKYYTQLMATNEQALNKYGDPKTMPPDEFNKIQTQMMTLEEQRLNALVDYINKSEPSLAPFVAISVLVPNMDFKVLSAAYDKLKAYDPQSKYVTNIEPAYQDFKQRYMAEQQTAVGTDMPEIALQDTTGKEVKLSSLEGKYVLVDFWASWCKPCRQENPNNVNIYNKYKNKGFEILGVSLDDKRESWVKAIQQDGLPWIHVSDLKGWETPIDDQFGFNGIPFTILVSPEGKIVDRGLRGAALEARLNELLN